MIGREDRLRNDLYCVGWGVKLLKLKLYDCSVDVMVSMCYHDIQNRGFFPVPTVTDSQRKFPNCNSHILMCGMCCVFEVCVCVLLIQRQRTVIFD